MKLTLGCSLSLSFLVSLTLVQVGVICFGVCCVQFANRREKDRLQFKPKRAKEKIYYLMMMPCDAMRVRQTKNKCFQILLQNFFSSQIVLCFFCSSRRRIRGSGPQHISLTKSRSRATDTIAIRRTLPRSRSRWIERPEASSVRKVFRRSLRQPEVRHLACCS